MRFRCDRCHYVFNQQMNYCTKCGCKDFWALTDDDFSEETQQEDARSFAPQEERENRVFTKKKSVIHGTLGAFLFAVPGALLYCFIYQIGFIAGIAGVAIYYLAYHGYMKFSKSAGESVKDKLIAFYVMIVTLLFSTFFMLVYDVRCAYSSEGIRLEYMEDFILAVDLLITDKQVQTGFIFDILAACLFGSIGVLTCKKKK